MPQEWKDQFHVTATPVRTAVNHKTEITSWWSLLRKTSPSQGPMFHSNASIWPIKKILTIKAPNHWIPCAFPVHDVTYSKLDSLGKETVPIKTWHIAQHNFHFIFAEIDLFYSYHEQNLWVLVSFPYILQTITKVPLDPIQGVHVDTCRYSKYRGRISTSTCSDFH